MQHSNFISFYNQMTDQPSILANFQKNLSSDIVCLVAHILLTVLITYNLKIRWNEFPIKQLSPLCTLIAALSFLVLNVLAFVGRLIQQSENLYDANYNPIYVSAVTCGQCRVVKNTSLWVLAIIYAGLRQLPLTLFTLKTLRVSLCFLDYKNQQLPRSIKKIFNSETKLILISVAYSVLISALNIIDLYWDKSFDQHSAKLSYEFLCPKTTGFADWIINSMRLIMFTFSYSLSILAYRQLDFKRFIFFIFIILNTQTILKVIFAFNKIAYTIYHEYYYHSLFTNLCGALVFYPYTNYNRFVKQPPSTAVLQNFDAFLNCPSGSTIMKCFAIHLGGGGEQQHNKYLQCFYSFIEVRNCKMILTVQPKQLPKVLPIVQKVLQNPLVAPEIVGSQLLLEKVNRGECSLPEIKRIQKNLMDFCHKNLYDQWKRTESRVFIQQQFKKNVEIDEKMNSLGISIGY